MPPLLCVQNLAVRYGDAPAVEAGIVFEATDYVVDARGCLASIEDASIANASAGVGFFDGKHVDCCLLIYGSNDAFDL